MFSLKIVCFFNNLYKKNLDNQHKIETSFVNFCFIKIFKSENLGYSINKCCIERFNNYVFKNKKNCQISTYTPKLILLSSFVN